MGGNEELRKNLLILSVIVLVAGIFYALTPSSGQKNPRLGDGEVADIKGLLSEWEVRGKGMYAYVETESGRYKEYTLLIDERTRAYRADYGEASRSLEPALLADVRGGRFVEIYYRRPSPAEGPKIVDTIVYWE